MLVELKKISDVTNVFFCRSFPVLTASINLTYFQIRKNTLFESLARFFAGNM